ncbi:hypothetical protein QJS04_geneDACA010849 [Acorus gramineus]|uniref:Uncharacterized protein n=1 Tax=Acorus gramineus TaxID=55184 RepID=A0AAV9B8L3_ACOGR|nr:hypothetical protein QJS04_geneDACA010849 [Acorus gramineus]
MSLKLMVPCHLSELMYCNNLSLMCLVTDDLKSLTLKGVNIWGNMFEVDKKFCLRVNEWNELLCISTNPIS